MIAFLRRRPVLIGAAIFAAAAAAALALVLLGAEGPAPPPPCRSQSFEGVAFSVCEADPARAELRLVWEGADGAALRGLSSLERDLGVAEAQRVLFAMNAGMFNAQGRPIGLYVEHGWEVQPINTNEGPGNFHLLPNGVFSVDAARVARVETAEAYLARGGVSEWATQSGPMLVIGGRLHPAFQEDGPSRLIRNGVGVRADGTAVFAISNDPVSFGKFARFFRDALACPDALFLDGTVSALWAPNLQRLDGGALLGPMVVALAPEG